jgi:hypothetical protein
MKRCILLAIITVLVTLFSCTAQDEDGIFIDIEKEIELSDAVVKGNIFDIVKYDGRLFAGGGKVYVKDDEESPRGWRVFSDSPLPDGLVVRLAVIGTKLTVECARTGYRNAFYEWSGESWVSGGSIPPKVRSDIDVIGTVTCETGGNPNYYGTPSGAYYINSEGAKTDLPGENTRAAIGNYEISAIYRTPKGAVYAATLGIGTTYGTKNNGLWAIFGETWNRE